MKWIRNKRVLLSTLAISYTTFFFSCQVTSETKSPAGFTLPDGFEIEQVADEQLVMFPMFASLDESGRLFLFESIGNVYETTESAFETPQFRINMLEDTNADGRYDKSTIFADSLRFPQGGVYHQGSLYVSSAPDLLKLTDTDGDGKADQREVLLSGWNLNVNANSLIGPFMGPDGWLYLTSAIVGFDVKTKEGEQLKGETARIWRVRPDGTQLEWISAGGMNNPVELTFTNAGEVLGTETYYTDPKGGLRDAIIHWTEGGVYPKVNTNITRDQLPLTGDLMPAVTQFSRVSPAGIMRYRNTAWGNDYYDNLYTVQFNTNRVLRHQLIRDGGTFRTEDEHFLVSNDENFHPTDVLEDADGSLLVVNTGGWFIKGCPLSQVSKPEYKGGIYRIRKKGTKVEADIYGNNIDWKGKSLDELAQYLVGKSPAIADRAEVELVSRGDTSVGVLSHLLADASAVKSHAKVIYALYKINTASAWETIGLGLKSTDEEALVATLRVIGYSNKRTYEQAVQSLLSNKYASVQRQAATTLGQIGSSSAVESLLALAGKTEDRFARHALIFSLMQLKEEHATAKGLSSTNTLVKTAALIALDQMRSKILQPQQVLNFWKGNDKQLSDVALWVLGHHPEWTPQVIKEIEPLLGQKSGNQDAIVNLLTLLSAEPAMQSFLGNLCGVGYSTAHADLALQVMLKSSVAKFPIQWRNGLAKILEKENSVELKDRVLDVIRLRNVVELDPVVKRLSTDQTQPLGIRIKSLEVASNNAELSLSDTVMRELIKALETQNDYSTTVRIATILSKAKLTASQLNQLAILLSNQPDSPLVGVLLPAFAPDTAADTGELLIQTLTNSKTLDTYSEDLLQKILANYPSSLAAAKSQLFSKLADVQKERLAYIEKLEGNLSKGSIENGRKLFFGKAVCASCHTIGEEGGHFGPDLTSIQRDRSVHDLLEAIVYPSSSFVRTYETYTVKTKSQSYTGIIAERTPSSLTMHLGPENIVRLEVDEVISIQPEPHSLMPQGLDKILTEHEMADLMVFLLGQDQDPEFDMKYLKR